MSRESFLARVREAARAGRAYRVHLHDTPGQVGYIGAGAAPVSHMASEVAAAGGQAHLVANLAAARETLSAIISECGARKALCWQHPVLDRLGLVELLDSLGVERLDHHRLASLPPAEQRAEMLHAEIGITSTTWAVAETGTLAVASQPGRERLASLLPPIHVAIVTEDQIVPDLFDLFRELQQAGLTEIASNLTLITGPSKTGDIELKLTTGVHGPGQWHVILVGSACE